MGPTSPVIPIFSLVDAFSYPLSQELYSGPGAGAPLLSHAYPRDHRTRRGRIRERRASGAVFSEPVGVHRGAAHRAMAPLSGRRGVALQAELVRAACMTLSAARSPSL